jgi:multicomponent Na+:H+ antiporter subunit E
MTQRLQHFALTFLIGLALWLLLVGTLDRQELVAGLLVAAGAATLALKQAPVFAGFRLTPTAPLWLLSYLAALTVALVRANLDMARRVLSPSLPIRPKIVRVSTSLRSDLGRLVLANSITLTPGTLTVDVEDDALEVHWVDCPPGTDLAAATQTIAAGFERHLRGFLK